MQHGAIKYQVWSCPASPQAGRGGDAAPRILLAEDNTLDQVTIRRLLEKENVQVRCVDNGRDAVEEAKTGGYDLILMDILMPEMDGFVAALKIREEEQADGGGGVPIIALTAYSLKAIQDKCRSVGMNGYLSKPMSARELRAVCGLFCALPPGKRRNWKRAAHSPSWMRKRRWRTWGGSAPSTTSLWTCSPVRPPI
ncbi:response regulator [Geobacter sp. FeAm09]|uniref:response regulator n=1 Tax=Geobacter sp. FeAm09 TaxID=2597769 RepID=UPI0011EC8535|nr:response regulator [Geobacter sp. FeAm09]QEM67989.1 response regulator [Geobacter sp. FeAm09]